MTCEQCGNILRGHRLTMLKELAGDGKLFRIWQEQIPNDGLIYLDLFNAETVLAVNLKILAEILVHQSYNFIKPLQLIIAFGRVLASGVFLAEGEEHRVTN